jgi:uncharacterized protein (DUF2236 family)
MWPQDRGAFDAYWAQAVERVSIDEPVRQYLHSLMTREHLPRALRGSPRFNTWVTIGFLPARFRDEMQLEWTAKDEKRFTRLLACIGIVQRRLPMFVRRFPFNLLLWDMRLRIRFGRPLV